MSPEKIQIKSSLKDYFVSWNAPTDAEFQEVFQTCRIAVVDKNVHEIYGHDAQTFGRLKHVIVQEAVEELKTAETCLAICSQLLELGFKRGETLLAVGGGIIQDLVTFSASILFRGIPWIFIPTTLLAQADSCIGGKSSINFGQWKNQLGNFYPPQAIYISPHYLRSLTDKDIRSGMGEVVKVHLLSGADMAQRIAEYFKNGQGDQQKFADAVFRALKEKAAIIQEDEFDTGKRLTLNLGHTFGHALETAADFGVPHGIAVAIGVDMAAYLAMKLQRISDNDYRFIRSVVAPVSKPADRVEINRQVYIDALRHDKKNKANQYCFILPCEIGRVEKVFVPMNPEIEEHILGYLSDQLPEFWR
ncbi:MAG: 3-dehydroquinate synthase [Acidobacteriota bacterium]|nr:3-dehydroquinate synthase [Acidobacteriota bacterium]